jgi:type II secretion system protein N
MHKKGKAGLSAKHIITLLAALAIVFYAPWFVITEETVRSLITDSISHESLSLEAGEIKKGLFYTISLDSLRLRGSHGEYLSFQDIHGVVNPLGLFFLRLNISFDGETGGGAVSGRVNLARKSREALFRFSKVRMEDVPLIQRAGIKGTGTLSGNFNMIDNKGHMDITAENAQFQEAVFGSARVPLHFFQNARCSVAIDGDTVSIVSMYFEGKDVRARLKGHIRNAFMDLIMEVMPGKSFLENPFLLAGLERYQISPGYYRIPVTGNAFNSVP